MNDIILNSLVKKPYPINAFPKLIRDANNEVIELIKPPDSLAAITMIAGMTFACQSLIKVKLPPGSIRGVNQNILGRYESGSRKTEVYKTVLKPIIDNDKRAMELYRSSLKKSKIDHAPWQAVTKGVKCSLAKAASKGEPTEKLEAMLAEHMKNKPLKPRLRTFLRMDLTEKALMEALQGDQESLAIATDEGHLLFRSPLMSSLGLLNRLWDSPESLQLDRAGDEHITAMNPIGSIFILTQSGPYNEYNEARGSMAKPTGHWARYLHASSFSNAGFRPAQPVEKTWIHLPKFHARIRELQDMHKAMIESGNVVMEIIEFSDDAKARWFEYADHIEYMQRPGGCLSDIVDFASKSLEIVARLAAVMHYFIGETGKITLDTLERAYALVWWHIEEYKYLFSSQSVMLQDQADAYAVAKWLRDRVWRGYGSNSYVAKNFLLRYGTVRNAKRLDAALDILESRSAIWMGRLPQSRKLYVNLMDNYFSAVI